jgi:(1->4)-alpha-D-glucan 1-alpha-D-glucosylmutase
LAGVFTIGEYIPLTATGAAADHIVSFARRLEGRWVIVVIPRHVYRLGGDNSKEPLNAAAWATTQVVLPPELTDACRCRLSGSVLMPNTESGEPSLSAAELFQVFPVALLTCESQ